MLGELFYGAMLSEEANRNIGRIDDFAATVGVVPCDKQTARTYGEIRGDLKRKGRPIPENDIWIAAVAIQHELTLVTHDAHFEHIDQLQRSSWK